jgi:acetyl-CoA synthetase
VKRDKDGYYWITGRTDDLLNVSGHLMSTSQIEGTIAADNRVAEAAAVSTVHQIKGQCVYCFLVLKQGVNTSKQFEVELKAHVRNSIGAIAVPDVLQFCRALPKTRSGKIMRRLLKKIAGFEFDFGDISTLQDETVLDELIQTRKQYPKLN